MVGGAWEGVRSMTRPRSAEGSLPAKGVSDFRAWLASQDLSALADDQRLALLSELELLTRAAAGVAVRTQVAFHTSQVAAQVADGVAPSRAGRAVPDDLAHARRTSPYWGSRELTSAKSLVVEMPCTLAALDRGDITLQQSRLVTEATTCLHPEDRAEVDRRLAGALAGASTREITATVRGLVYEVDPKGFVDRARKAARDRGVSIRPCPDVMALLSTRLPATQAIACHTALKDKAVSMRASGDPRSQAQLMADLLFERLTGRSVVDGVDVEVGVVMTDAALFEGTSEAADLVGYGPVPAEMARDLLRPEVGAATGHGTDDHGGDETQDADTPGDKAQRAGVAGDEARAGHTGTGDVLPVTDPAADVCPEGIRCTSWSCSLVHGSPEARARSTAEGTGVGQGTGAGQGSSTAPQPGGPGASGREGSPGADPATPSSSAATRAARVWLRRLWTDPATGVLTGRDTRRRLFTGSLRAALVARDKTCRNTWCGAPIRAIDHKIPVREDGPTSATNGQGLCQRCNGARELPRATPPAPDDYRPPPPLLPALLEDRAPPSAA